MILDFLNKVLPEGLIVLAKPGSTGFIQTVCDTLDMAVKTAESFDAQGKDCYFGLGSLIARVQIRESDGKRQVRAGPNISSLKCLFLDLDVDPENPDKYDSQADAIRALKEFCQSESFPAPMLVNSGGGIHVYWPFDRPVPAEQWRVLARTFKSALAAYGIKADPTRTADSSSVLRVVGTHNYKHGGKRPVTLIRDAGPYPRKEILLAVCALADKYHVAPVSPVSKPAGVLGDNVKKEYPPSDIREIAKNCAQIGDMLTTGGRTEIIWFYGLQLARHCDKPDEAALLISQAYPNFQPSEMNKKLDNLTNSDMGPSVCTQFMVANPALCDVCPQKGKISTPMQLGRNKVALAPLAPGATPAEPDEGKHPYPYALNSQDKLIKAERNGTGVEEHEIIHEYDIRPVKRTHSERSDCESTIWKVKQPLNGWTNFTVEQSLLAKPEALHGLLLSKGLYVTPGRAKAMVSYMVAYIKQLQTEVITERLFSRVGWREEFQKFVLGDAVYERDGTTSQHQMSPEIKAELPGLYSGGELNRWKDAIQFLNAPGHEAHRFMLYAGFGAPLLHMTGHKGAIINSTGAPGAGKTTAISAAMSIYGHPVDFLFNGTRSGSTVNAMYSSLAARNHLPMGMDEITRIDPKIFGEFALSVSQGMGKMVNTRAGTLAHNRPSWATLVLTSANTDVYSTLGQSRADAAAESMRVLQIPFTASMAHSKAEADQFLRELSQNFGLAGHVYIPYVAQNYDLIKKKIQFLVELVDQKAGISSGERFWSGAIAASFVGAMTGVRLGLLQGFPIEADFEWACNLPAGARGAMQESLIAPRELIAEFLETYVAETLVVSQTKKAGMSVRVDQAPRGALFIRHEADADRLYLMKSEFKRYCVEIGANYGDIQKDLEVRQILLDRNKQVVLGKGTDFGKGQVRCWEIDMTELRAGSAK